SLSINTGLTSVFFDRCCTSKRLNGLALGMSPPPHSAPHRGRGGKAVRNWPCRELPYPPRFQIYPRRCIGTILPCAVGSVVQNVAHRSINLRRFSNRSVRRYALSTALPTA